MVFLGWPMSYDVPITCPCGSATPTYPDFRKEFHVEPCIFWALKGQVEVMKNLEDRIAKLESLTKE